MLKLFENVGGYIHPKNLKESTGGWVLILHHRFTAFLLIIFCCLVCARQYVGEPISCIQDKKGDNARINEKVMNTYCFITSTYIIPNENAANYHCNENFAIHPGIRTPAENDKPNKRYAYYQWVPIVLFLQAVSFTVPYFFWSHCEGGLINKLLNCITDIDLQKEINEADKPAEEGKKKSKTRAELIGEYFVNSIKTHQFLAFGWFACDYLALLIAVLNFYLTNKFLGGDFSNYGMEVYNYLSKAPVQPEGCFSPVDEVFPKVTKCLFRKYGPTGTLETVDAMCVLALNVVNEKIYSMMWFWFFLLILLTIIGIIIKLTMLVVLTCTSNTQTRIFPVLALKIFGAPLSASPLRLRALAPKLGISDWVFFSLLVKNMTPYMYEKFMDSVTDECNLNGVKKSKFFSS